MNIRAPELPATSAAPGLLCMSRLPPGWNRRVDAQRSGRASIPSGGPQARLCWAARAARSRAALNP